MNLRTFNRLESEVRGYVRAFPTVFHRAEGARLHDEAGRRYLDFFAGAGTLNYGHNNPAMKARLTEYVAANGIVHGLDMATSAKQQFLETFEQAILRPRDLTYKFQFTGPTGTNAVEAALKLARQVKGRSNVLAFTNAFHGVSGASLAATGNAKFRHAAGFALQGITFMPYDGYLGQGVNTLDYIDRLLSDGSSGIDHPAAAIVETVQGEGGVNAASMTWLQGLARLCRKHDMLLIVDDIQAGCGRTGSFFSFEPAGLDPDIVTLSKSLSGYGLPMALVLMKPSLDVWSPGAHNGTFRGNNLAFVTATAAIDTYWRSGGFADQVARKGQQIRSHLERLVTDFPEGGFSVRGRGMMLGLASTQPGLPEKIASNAFAAGLVIETSGAGDDVLKLLPPLTIGADDLATGLELIGNAVADVLGKPHPAKRGLRVVNSRGGDA